jgi:opacity protein-like surface antigen
MKTIIGVAMLVAATPAAMAQTSPGVRDSDTSYASLSVGATAGSDIDYSFATGDATVQLDEGFAITDAYGRRFGGHWRGEASLAWSDAGIDRVTRRGGPTILIYEPPGSVTTWSLTGAVYYDFATEGAFRPYVGAGIGAASLDINDRIIREAGTALNLRAVAGANWAVSDRAWLFAEARYYAYLRDADADDTLVGAVDDLDVGQFGIHAGVRFGF